MRLRVNAVFEGGGVKAIALVGAVKAAEQNGIQFEKVAGTSSGAIVASLIAAGYSADEMRDLIMEMPFQSFVPKGMLHRLNWIGPAIRIMVKKGLYSGLQLEQWISEKLSKKGISTFGDLKENQLRVIASDITQGKMLVLPDDIRQYGYDPKQLKVSEAIMMSSAIPYFFEPVMIRPADGKRRQTYYIVDGALLSNFPLWLFDQKYKYGGKIVPAIGFRLVGKNEREPIRIHGPISMFRALFATMMGAHDERHIGKNAAFRTVKIPTLGVQTTEFGISQEKAKALYRTGLEAGNEFFRKWSMSEYMMQFEKVVLSGLKGDGKKR